MQGLDSKKVGCGYDEDEGFSALGDGGRPGNNVVDAAGGNAAANRFGVRVGADGPGRLLYV